MCSSMHMDIRGQFVGAVSFLPTSGFMGCRSGPQAWQQVVPPNRAISLAARAYCI